MEYEKNSNDENCKFKKGFVSRLNKCQPIRVKR